MNKAILIGRVGRDPKSRVSDNDRSMSDWTLATSERYKDRNGESQETTVWHNIVAWGKVAEFASKYLKKGMLVAVVGKINNRKYEKDGETKYVSEIVAGEVTLLSKREDSQADRDTQPSTHGHAATPDDDLPF